MTFENILIDEDILTCGDMCWDQERVFVKTFLTEDRRTCDYTFIVEERASCEDIFQS